ncbi:beta-galactosidase [Shewanella sp. 10N.286.48.B5]|uniref:beta-galactosidase n=1 Tax=Shewanella sp. 10N.286.48.B5 TaxID=1880834 RepID=UPI000C854AF0|nr:beta-galactosidase [Shewanella sp. 10N.286.48.B5]PMH89115.1 agarase [Shewanella sp. 10N.286.48.B5]
MSSTLSTIESTKRALLVTSIIAALSGCQSESVTFNVTPRSEIDSTASQTIQLIDFNKQQTDLINTVAADTHINDGAIAVKFKSENNSYSNISFNPDTPWDWSALKDFNLAFDIANTGKHSVQLYLDISDIDGANYTRTVNIPVGSTSNTYYAKMAGHDLATPDGDHKVELNFNSGLRSNPDTWESDEVQFTSMWGKKNLNTKGIAKISLSVQSNLHDKEILLSNIRIRQNPEFNKQFLTHIVDQFGQNNTEDFVGKINNEVELENQRVAEAKTLSGKVADGRSQYGGWLAGPKLAATGYFRTEKVNDKWSLVDPDGYLYLATGLDIIRLSNSSTMTGYDFAQQNIVQRTKADVTPEDSQKLNRVSDAAIASRFKASDTRANMFNWLPKYNEPLGKHFGYRRSAHSGPLKHGETYSFYSANLERKYGNQPQGYMQAWEDTTINRMLDWGFTSLGNWTDPRYYDNNKIPYFANGWIIGNYKTVSSGDDFWGAMPDVFDPEFEVRAFETAKVVYEEVKNNPWCVGVFIDNEKSFGRSDSVKSHYGIVVNTLTRDGKDVPTKAAFTAVMKQKYGEIQALNTVWEKEFTSWEAFDRGIDSSINNERQIADYGVLLSAYADKYFSTVDKALQKYMPNHMYLGSRFPDWGMPIEVVKSSAKFVDVVSFNSYKEGLTKKSWKFLEDIDMPSIIGEFHIGAKDSGLYHPGLIHAADQQDRGVMYQDYMNSVIDNPYFIGAHWFQYIDSPITGRAYDGENYNVGFISVTDTPYPFMVEAAKTVNGNMYQRRFGKQELRE